MGEKSRPPVIAANCGWVRKKARPDSHLHGNLGMADYFDSCEALGRGVLFDPVVQCKH